jgi:gluconolactonase
MHKAAETYEIHHRRYLELIIQICALEKLADGMLWAEGPVWFADHDYLVWSDIPNDRLMRWVPGLGATVHRAPSDYTNGNTRDRQGRLVSCQHGHRRVARLECDGTLRVLADAYQGKRLNSPNDVVVSSDGAIWFTDPPYGILSDYEGHRADPEYGGSYVFRVDPASGEVQAVATDFVKPNGLCFSPDESRLYVADSGVSHDPDGPHHIRSFRVEGGKRLSGGEVFVEVSPGVPDGFRVDREGNVWTSARDGVHTYAPDGTLLGKIRTPAMVSNLCFGGPKRNRLFITATDAVWAIYVAATGAQHP